MLWALAIETVSLGSGYGIAADLEHLAVALREH